MAQMSSDQPMGHKGTTHAIIIMMLVALMAVETATLGYVVTKLGSTATPKEVSGVTSTAYKSLPPILWVEKSYPNALFGNKLFLSDPATLGKRVVLDRGTDFVELLAVPQIGYNGKVFLNLMGEGGDFYPVRVFEFDPSKPEQAPVELKTFAPGLHIAPSQIRVSVDQTKIAYIPFTDNAIGASPANTIMVLDLLTGQTFELGHLSEEAQPLPNYAVGYTFIQKDGEAIGGMGSVSFDWKDDSCVIATVYQSPLSDADVSTETFCIK